MFVLLICLVSTSLFLSLFLSAAIYRGTVVILLIYSIYLLIIHRMRKEAFTEDLGSIVRGDTSLEHDVNSLTEDLAHLLEVVRNFKVLKRKPSGDAETIQTAVEGSTQKNILTQLKELTHSLENLLDHMRKGKVQPNSGVIDLLLAGNDLLNKMSNLIKRACINASLEGHFLLVLEYVPLEDLIRQIDSLLNPVEPVQESSPLDIDLLEDLVTRKCTRSSLKRPLI